MELGLAATAEEFLITIDFLSPAENLQVRDAGEFFYSRSVLLKIYSKCKSQRWIFVSDFPARNFIFMNTYWRT